MLSFRGFICLCFSVSTLMEKRSFITLKYLQQSKCYASALEGTSRKAWSPVFRGLGCRDVDSRKCWTPGMRVFSGTWQDVSLWGSEGCFQLMKWDRRWEVWKWEGWGAQELGPNWGSTQWERTGGDCRDRWAWIELWGALSEGSLLCLLWASFWGPHVAVGGCPSVPGVVVGVVRKSLGWSL